MDSQKVDLFLAANQKFFSPMQILTIKDRLLALDDDRFAVINALDYKDPTMMIIVSIFAGSLGIDRFMLGDTGYRCPGCGLQRAAHALLHGHLTEAFSYNRALLFTIPLLLLYGYAELFPQRAPRLRRTLQHPLTLGLLVIAVIGWWIARNLLGW